MPKKVLLVAGLLLFICLAPFTPRAQDNPIELRVEKDLRAKIADRIDKLSKGPKPREVTLHGGAEENWACASAALERTKAAIEWVEIYAGVTKTFAAAAKAVKEILENVYGLKGPGLAVDILSAYVQSDTLEEFTQKLAEIAVEKGFGKLLEKKTELTDVDRKLIEEVAERIWKALGGNKDTLQVPKSFDDPLCREKTDIVLWIATEGAAPASGPEAENLVRKNCEKRCAQARDKWLQERSAAIASDRDAKAQEQGLVEAQANRDNARDKLKVASESMAEANRKLENLAKRRRDVNPGQRRREEAELKLAQTRAREEMARQQSEIERLESDIARLTKSSAESRASADKQLKAAKDAENAYRSCLNNCYDAASKSGSPRDKDEARKLLAGQTPLTMPVEELLTGYVPPTSPESPAKTVVKKKILHFEAHGDCHCRFPQKFPEKERLGKFAVVGIAELVPQTPAMEGKTIVINYTLGRIDFDVVASCGCPTTTKSETATPTQTRAETATAPARTEQTANYYLPSGMETLNQTTAAALYTSPSAPAGSWCPNLNCCCQYCEPVYLSAAAQRPVNIRLSLAMNKIGDGKAIHIAYQKGRYVAQAYLQWSASGGSGLRVELEVQRPRSAVFEKLVTNRGPDNGFLFETTMPGTYLFRATATDASGSRNFNTLSVTFPFIEESEVNPQ